MKKAFSSDYQKHSFSSSLPLGGLITILIFVALPFTQMVSVQKPPTVNLVDHGIVIQPPARPPDPPEPEKKEEKVEEIEIKEREQRLTLDEINRALVPGDGGLGKGVSGHIFDITDRFEDMIYNPEQLEKPPVPLVTFSPVYPQDQKVYRIEGEVHLIFIVDEAGDVKRPKVLKSPNRSFSENAIKAIRQWKFEPGEKDDEKVKTRVALVMSFTLRRD